MREVWIILAAVGCSFSTIVGCKPQGHDRVYIDDFSRVGTWRPEEVFSDPQVIQAAVAIAKVDLAEIDRLLKSGVDVNSSGRDSVSLLGWTLMMQNKSAYRRLLERGADPNALMLGALPILEIVASNENDSEWLELALKHSGNPNVSNARRNKIGDHYIDGKETPIFEAIENRSQHNVELLLQFGADVDARNIAEMTPVLFAASQNAFEFALLLIERGADYKLKDNLGHDVAHYVIAAPMSPGIDEWKWREKVIQLLESKGVDFQVESIKVRDSKEPRHEGLYQRWEERMEWLKEARLNDRSKE